MKPRDIVLNALTQAAEQGAPCPVGRDLDLLIKNTTSTVSGYHVKELVKAGLIVIEHLNTKRRRIRIVASGKATGWAVHRKGLRYPCRAAS